MRKQERQTERWRALAAIAAAGLTAAAVSAAAQRATTGAQDGYGVAQFNSETADADAMRLAGSSASDVVGAGPTIQVLTFETSGGVTVTFPHLDTIACDDVESLRDQIDALSYRTVGPTLPEHPGDRSLYHYERDLQAMDLHHCGPRAR